MLAQFAARGIAPTRIDLAGRADHFAFLHTYDRIDIALDTFPYNGGTTTTEALWQGVPVLTCNGDRWAARTSRSLLLAAGFADWVAEDIPAFIAMAIKHTQNSAVLATTRHDMRARLAASAACDTETLCRALEAIYTAQVSKALLF